MNDLAFVAIDFETANSFRGSPCSVGLVYVEKGQVVDEQQFLCRPPGVWGPDDFDPFNISIHGITFDMVKNEVGFSDLWKEIYRSIGDFPLVAHNAAFDVGVIREALAFDDEPWTPFKYTCSLVLSRRLLSLPSYGLVYVADELQVPLTDHHDSLADARACAQIVQALARQTEVNDLDALLEKCQVQWGRLLVDDWRGSTSKSARNMSLPVPRTEASPDHFLYGRHVVLSGALPYGISREIAWERIAHFGGIPQKSVTKATTLLVVGDLDPTRLVPGSGMSSKMKKAFDLQDKGQPIEVMAGGDFMAYLD
ncbi:MAG: exonuclease [Actinobacteria bacterium]|jgi:DNA polymerase-3 subunit epsilon|nr:exonuclease [Actinomycetota bacterium]